jgi:hypothetical protein
VVDWERWHEAYEDPASDLSRRLEVVRARLSDALDRCGAGDPRLLSLCAGEGRDVLPVLTVHPKGRHVTGVLVEREPVLADRAVHSARDSGLDNVEVRCADAGDPASFRDQLPVDVLLLCGVFGNIDPSTVHDVVYRVPAMVVPGGSVIWTRGSHGAADHRPQVRRWFEEAGIPEISFDGPPATFGVGVNEVREGVARPIDDSRLFTFLW